MSIFKIIWITLLSSLPLNFLAVEGIGNLYFSTIVLFLSFLAVFVVSVGKLILNKYAIVALILLAILSFTTFANIIFGDSKTLKNQIVLLIIHFQLVVAFIVGVFLIRNLDSKFVLNSILIAVIFFSFRIFIDDYENAFNFSSVRGLRVECLFAGGVNNFALINGLGFLIAFFSLNRGIKRSFLLFYLLLVIVMTMSRGALLGLIFTLFVTALFEKNQKTLKLLLNISFALTISTLLLYFLFDETKLYLEKFSSRFLSVITGEVSLEKASSGRGLIIKDLYHNHMKESSFFEWVFGHGVGSIDFKVNGHPYESSHNIILDVLYRNGLLILILSLLWLLTLINSFLVNRKREIIVFFAIFVFLHFEILVNPFIYSAQTGWVYSILMAILIFRKRTT